MEKPSVFEIVLDELNRSGSRYVVVGGVAVNLRGYQRFTSDLDIAIDLAPRAASIAVQALVTLGFKPRVPVSPEDFGNPAKREEWIEQKGAKVISFLHPSHPTFSVDVFVDPPIPFERLYADSQKLPLGRVFAQTASIDALLEMKRVADRDQDRLDIGMLEQIKKRLS